MSPQTPLFKDIPFKIGILSYNHPDLTERVIRSCLKLAEASQITLLHNGSEARWVEKLKNLYPLIEHLELQTNVGYSGGVNFLLSAILKDHEWCLLLTNDVELITFAQPQNIALVAPLIYRRKKDFVDSIGGLFTPQRGHLVHCRSSEEFQRSIYGSFQYVPGTAFWIHQNIFNTVGFFDSGLNTYWEDVDYSMRVQRLGFKLTPCTKTILIHGVGKTCHKKKHYTSFLFPRNKYLVSLRYGRHALERWLFRTRYWSHWTWTSLKASFMGDKEFLSYKIKILKSILKNEV